MFIDIGDIKVSQRLREIDQDKVDDLVESIGLVGNHRLEVYRILEQ